MFCLVKHSFSNLRSKLVTDDVIKKRLWRHHLDLSNYWFASKDLTLISNLSHQYVIFQKNGNDVTSNDVINFKENNLNLNLKTNFLVKTWHFYSF